MLACLFVCPRFLHTKFHEFIEFQSSWRENFLINTVISFDADHDLQARRFFEDLKQKWSAENTQFKVFWWLLVSAIKSFIIGLGKEKREKLNAGKICTRKGRKGIYLVRIYAFLLHSMINGSSPFFSTFWLSRDDRRRRENKTRASRRKIKFSTARNKGRNFYALQISLHKNDKTVWIVINFKVETSKLASFYKFFLTHSIVFKAPSKCLSSLSP